MSVIDYLLHSLIKRLQKVQKLREKRKKKKNRILKSLRKIKKFKSARRSRISGKSTSIKRKKRTPGRSAKRIIKKPSKVTKKKPASRKSPARSRANAKKVKRAKKALKKVSEIKIASNEVCVGEVTHFFSRIQVIVLKMNSGNLLVGDRIRISGHKTDFIQKVKSLQIESVDVKSARKGQLVGLKVSKKAKPGDQVFKLTA